MGCKQTLGSYDRLKMSSIVSRELNHATYGDRNIPIRRPKEPSTVTTLTLIQKLSLLNFDKNQEDVLSRCVEMFNTLAPNEEVSSTILQQLHASCLTECNLSRKFATFTVRLMATGKDVLKFLLPLLKEDYEGKESFFGTQHFRNALTLHGEVYNLFVSGPNEGISLLAAPLVHYLKLAVTSDDEKDIQAVALQMVLNSKKLNNQGGQEYHDFLSDLRSKLLEQTSNRCQTFLLLAIEISCGNFPVTPNPLRDFYIKKLGTDYVELENRANNVSTGTSSEEKHIETNGNVSSSVQTGEEEKLNKNSKVTVEASADRKPLQSISADVEAVRKKMRARGLLPPHTGKNRANISEKGEKDDDFYGVQLPRSN